MKATLEFNMPDDAEEFKMANRGRDYFCSLWDIKSFIRGQLKHGIQMSDENLLLTIQDMIPEDME